MQSGSLRYYPSHTFFSGTHSSRLPSSHNYHINFFLLPAKGLHLQANHAQPGSFPRKPGFGTLVSSFPAASSLLGIPENGRRRLITVKASSVPDSIGGSPHLPSGERSGSTVETLTFGFLFGLWYLLNIYFNIFNKQVLKVYPYPITMTTFQLAVGISLIVFMWTTGLHKKPKVNSSQLLGILPLAIIHTSGNLFTNLSLGKVAVSFTHTIKALEPFFTVVLSAVFLGEVVLTVVIYVLFFFPIFKEFLETS